MEKKCSKLCFKKYLISSRTSYFYDIGLGATYFIHTLEPRWNFYMFVRSFVCYEMLKYFPQVFPDQRFHMVTICEGKRGEKDSAINAFVQETVGQIRLKRISNHQWMPCYTISAFFIIVKKTPSPPSPSIWTFGSTVSWRNLLEVFIRLLRQNKA